MKHILLLFFSSQALLLGQDSIITKENWPNHPARKLIVEVVSDIDGLIRNNKLKSVRGESAYSKPYEPTLKEYFVDQSARIRKYIEATGSDDSALNFEYYYDSKGTLRFVFIEGGAVNGSRLEHRIYFSEAGKRIWESHEYLQGPGYTFPEIWPDAELVFNPKLK
ncbi:hypothetical protein K1X84_15495 [bacterium]|nr:hypothetical protein [bacterium]